MVDQATRAICLFAAITGLIIVCVRTSGFQSSDLPVLAVVVAPYLLLGLMAGSVRQRSADSSVLLFATLLLSLVGTALLAFNAPPHPTRPEPGLALSVTMIGVPLLQLVAASLLGLVLLVRRMMA